MMKVIGLAGRAGSGKSTVARILAQRSGIEWIDLDEVAWKTYSPGTDVYHRLIEAFGSRILDASRHIDRRRLAQIALETPQSRHKLNELVHPAVSLAIHDLVRDARQRKVDVLLVEGALLASSPYVDRSIYDQMLWLETSDDTRVERLTAMNRRDHAARGHDIVPQGEFMTVSGEGSIEQVADRMLRIIGSDSAR
ncbi:dephospho-CoA kinase [Candidatus Bipolaricaulota bacterium]|nr:dephospho-CoA kinase [Candidatus Bipolaricaulota bacterium]